MSGGLCREAALPERAIRNNTFFGMPSPGGCGGMATNTSPSKDQSGLTTRRRLVIFVAYLLGALALNFWLTGDVRPLGGDAGLWVLSVVAYLSFALLSAPIFSRPEDTLASSIAAGALLWSTQLPSDIPAETAVAATRWIGLGLAFVTAGVSLTGAITRRRPAGSNPEIAKVTFRMSRRLGAPGVLFTPVALIGAFGFFSSQPDRLVVKVLVWVILVAMRPLELAWISWLELRSRRSGSPGDLAVGQIARVDSPDIVRVEVIDIQGWNAATVLAVRLADDSAQWLLPLFTQVRDGTVVGTGLCIRTDQDPIPGATRGMAYRIAEPPDRQELVKSLTKIEILADLIGFVVEESNISHIRFEVASERKFEEGRVVFCRQRDCTVYYQIVDARTAEETFERNPRGTHIITASQLGVVKEQGGFTRFPWLPGMNTPVFLGLSGSAVEPEAPPEDTFQLGVVPGTDMPVVARIEEMQELHTAILGVTGTGKTEMALDLVRQAVAREMRVFCVDFTGEYLPRLSDLQPISLAVAPEGSTRLSDIVERIETGQYRGASEREELRSLMEVLRPQATREIADFLDNAGGGVAVFELPDIANTRASLRATELYLSEIFQWARTHRRAQRILVVLEEAHTVIPETNIFGFDYGETHAVVARMAQIALQGRKYGVGLLLLSQRTALVSKTLLSQCNTVVSFSLVDKTSLDYLRNVFSAEHVDLIPNLPRLHAIAHGSAILSERPIVVELPFDQAKLEASEALRTAQDSPAGPGADAKPPS